MQIFKDNLHEFLGGEVKVTPPRIMFTGIRGSGLNSQLLKINEKFNIPIFKMRENFVQRIREEKEKRK
jgi:hypothetical protein